MECEAINDRMIELLYGELEEADASAAEAHLAGCESCAEAYARLSSGHELASMLTRETPPDSFRDVVMRAAREKAAERAPEVVEEPLRKEVLAAPREEQEEERGLWASIVHWIGGFAMRPQLAMAMTLLLMVGIGLWYLPELRRHDPADAHSIVDPMAGDEVGPSASLEPAEPLALETDPRTGRIRTRDADELARGGTPAPAQTGVVAAGDEVEAADEDESQLIAELAELDTTSPRAHGEAEQAEPGEVVSEPLESPEAAIAQMDLAPGEGLGRQGGADGMGSSGAAEAPPPVVQAPAYATQAGQVREEAMPSPAPRQPQPTAPQPAAPPATLRTVAPGTTVGGSGGSSQVIYERGVQRFQQRDYRGAADDFGSVVRRPDTDARRLLPSALHRLAQSQRAAGDCRAAVGSYEQLLSRYRAYSGAPNAMIEAADCYRRLGQLSQARRWLEVAQQSPAVASAAQRELSRITAAERASERLESEATTATPQ